MIRILQVVSSLNINAGAMSVIMNYYRSIDREEVQFDFWYFFVASDSHQKEIEELGGRVYHMPYHTLKLRDQQAIRDFFREHQGEYRAIHCHPIWSSAILAPTAKKSGIAHIIQHAHSTRYSEKKSSEIRNRLLVKFIGFFATDFIACNPEAAFLFGKRIAKSGRVFILPNAICVENFRFDRELRKELRKELGIAEEALVVGSVGRLSSEKNPLFIVDIFAELRKRVPDARLLLVGDGVLRQEIEMKIKKLGLSDAAVLTGRRRDIQKILSGMDLFLMPSIFEGTPVASIEARTSGLPCLLSDTITKSLAMQGIRYLSLKAAASEWAEQAQKDAGVWKERNRLAAEDMAAHGFDIRLEAKRILNYYMGLE